MSSSFTILDLFYAVTPCSRPLTPFFGGSTHHGFHPKYPFKFQQNHRWMTCCPPQLPTNAPSFLPLLYMAWSCWITTLHSWFTWLLFREGENRHQFQSNFEANQPSIPLSPFQGQGSFVTQTTQRPYTKLTLYCP